MALLLREFAEFWREHADILVRGTVYHEVAPQLVLMGFLQRLVRTPVRSLRDPPGPPGGGLVSREYGAGRGRIDILVRWPYTDADGKQRWQREAVETKVWWEGKPDPLRGGLGR